MIQWNIVREELATMLDELTRPHLNVNRRTELQKKSTYYNTVLTLHDKVETAKNELQENKELLKDSSDDLAALCQEEIRRLNDEKETFEAELEDILYPADEKDERSVFLEIRSAAGGDEASLFAADLYRMYSLYALRRNWNISIVEAQITEVGGYKEVVAYIKGKGAYKRLKFESGVHRVQRVPSTEGAGRIHTSTVTVAVLPEVDEVEISIKTEDLRIDTYRSSGAGGQHVNTTDSAIRITHLPTGLVVTCQDERSQTKNKQRALKTLQARLYALESEKQAKDRSKHRKDQIGSGDRSEKIRTYNFPQNRVSDHRIELTLKKLDLIMLGDLDDIIKPLRAWELEERRKSGSLLPTTED